MWASSYSNRLDQRRYHDAGFARLIAVIVSFKTRFVFDPAKPDGTPRKLLDVAKHAALGCTAGCRPSLNDPSIRRPRGPSSTQHDNVADYQCIHLGAQEAVERLLGSANHRLVLVERRVKHHWHAGHVPEIFD